MALSTVDIQKLKGVAAELDRIYAGMMGQIDKLDGHMSALTKLWKGEGAQSYQNAYMQNTENFLKLAESIHSCSSMMSSIAVSYSKADLAASDVIKSKMGGRK